MNCATSSPPSPIKTLSSYASIVCDLDRAVETHENPPGQSFRRRDTCFTMPRPARLLPDVLPALPPEGRILSVRKDVMTDKNAARRARAHFALAIIFLKESRFSAIPLVMKRKTTVYLEDDLLRATKVAAARTGKRDYQVVEEALRAYLGLELLERVGTRSKLREDEAIELAYQELHQSRRS